MFFMAVPPYRLHSLFLVLNSLFFGYLLHGLSDFSGILKFCGIQVFIIPEDHKHHKQVFRKKIHSYS